MSIGSDPSRIDIYNFMETNTRGTFVNSTQKGLKELYGTVTFTDGTNYFRNFFNNTAKSSIPSNWATNIVAFNNRIDFDIIVAEWGNFPIGFGAKMVIIVEKRISGGTYSQDGVIDNITNNNDRSYSSTGLSSATDYEFRLKYYNGYNRDSAGYFTSTSQGIQTSGLSSIYLTYDASSSSTACSKWADPTNYVQYWYVPSGTFPDATDLYTSDGQTDPAPDGYYARGVEGSFQNADYYRQVTGGNGELITGTSSC